MIWVNQVPCISITKEDADGNQNFTTGQDGYVLSRTMDEIKESGSVVLEGSDVADARVVRSRIRTQVQRNMW